MKKNAHSPNANDITSWKKPGRKAKYASKVNKQKRSMKILILKTARQRTDTKMVTGIEAMRMAFIFKRRKLSYQCDDVYVSPTQTDGLG